MVAAQTLRGAGQAGLPVKVVLVERRGTIGEGVAYSTREAVHLLNVPAGRMSAWPDRPDDFVQWASRRYGAVKPTDFLPRRWYGEYVRESLLSTAVAPESDRPQLAVVFDEVRRVARHPSGGWMVHLARDRSFQADAVILTVGHRPPSDPIGKRWRGPRTRFLSDPWRPFGTNVVGPDDPTVVLGSGLTAVDTVLSLCQQPRRGPITLVSRHGLVPLAHSATPVAPVDLTSLVSELVAGPGGVRTRTLLRKLRDKARDLESAGGDWRSIVDGLRPHTARLWQSMTSAERRRFLARLRPFWEVHRHRMPLAVAEPFRALLAAGTVRLVAGRVEEVQAEDEGVRLVVRERGSRAPDRMGGFLGHQLHRTAAVEQRGVQPGDRLAAGCRCAAARRAVSGNRNHAHRQRPCRGRTGSPRPVPGRHLAQVHGLGEYSGPGIAQPRRQPRPRVSCVCWNSGCRVWPAKV